MGFAPLNVLIPTHCTGFALVPAQSNTAPEIFRDMPSPTRLVNCAINGLDLIPTLVWDDIGKISRRKVLSAHQAGKKGDEDSGDGASEVLLLGSNDG